MYGVAVVNTPANLSLTTKYHQMQGIDLILRHWDSTEYANLGTLPFLMYYSC